MEKRYCKKCGRPLDRGDIDYCRGCFEEEKGENYSEYQKKIQDEKDNSYTNIVANDFKIWSRNVNILGIIIAIVVVIYAISNNLLNWIIGAFFVYCTFKATSLLLLAVAEIIQKLQNIEDNTKK